MHTAREVLRLIDRIKARNVFALLGSGGGGGEPTITAGTTSQYWRGDKTFQTLNKAAVGLANAENTADADKPISTATAGALAGKAASSHSHAQGDVTGLATALSGKLDTSHAGAGGTAHANAVAAGAAGFMTGADKTKLDGIATGATANATDANLRDRSTHTGAQATSTVTGLDTALAGKAASAHGHATSDVTGLDTALAGKAATSHGHGIADTTGLQSELNLKANLTGAALVTPSLSAPTFSVAAGVTAGTAAQGQGALTSDVNVITTAAASPSGVTLPTATAGRWVVVINRGANAINVYPATGASIDGITANLPVSIPSGAMLEFMAQSTTAWFSTQSSANPILLGTTYYQQRAQVSKAAAATLTIAELLTGIIQYTGAVANLTLPTGTLIDAGVMAGLAVDRAFDFLVVNTGSGIATLAVAAGVTNIGALTVANGTSARFIVRKTAANTFLLIRG